MTTLRGASATLLGCVACERVLGMSGTSEFGRFRPSPELIQFAGSSENGSMSMRPLNGNQVVGLMRDSFIKKCSKCLNLHRRAFSGIYTSALTFLPPLWPCLNSSECL